MRRYFAIVSGGLVAIAAYTACVGDSSGVTTTPGQGAQGQACFANSTCLTGLTCTNNVCGVATGADASSGGTSTSSSSSSSSSSSTGGTSSTSSSSSTGGNAQTKNDDCAPLGVSAGPRCPLQTIEASTRDPICTGDTSACCPGAGCQKPGSDCAASYNDQHTVAAFNCFSDAQCPTNLQCCTSGSFSSANEDTCEPYSAVFDAPATCKKPEDCYATTHLCVPADGGKSTCNDGETCRPTWFDVKGVDGIEYRKSVGVCFN